MAVKTKTSVLLRLAYGMAFGALAATSPALAADVAMPVYKAAAAPAAYNWSGFYLGVTAGGGMSSLPVTDMDDFLPFTNGALKSGGAVGGIHARVQLAVHAVIPCRSRRRLQLGELQGERHDLLRQLRSDH